MTTTWKIVQNLITQQFTDIGSYAVLILNRPVKVQEELMCKLWNAACFRATADGGTDQWYNFLSMMKDKSKLNQIHPDLVSGDFDSITPGTLQNCKQNGVNIVETPDQDKTDFTKALEEILKRSKVSVSCVVAVVENSGRLDHTMSNLNTLFTSPISLFILCAESVTWLLPPGCHKIDAPRPLVDSQTTCGLIPLGAPCIVSTSGLKWNLNNTKMEFGGLISSCNTYSSDCNGSITVETDSNLLFTVNLELN